MSSGEFDDGSNINQSNKITSQEKTVLLNTICPSVLAIAYDREKIKSI